MLRMALRESLHHQGAALGGFGRQQQVHKVGHQEIRVHRAAMLSGELREKTQVEGIVVSIEKARGAVMAAVPNVQGYPRDDEAGSAWHKSQQRPAPPIG